jgi:hypothetical protein
MASASKLKAVLSIGASLDKASVGAAYGKLRKEQDKLTRSIADTKLEQQALKVEMRGLKKGAPQLAKLQSRYDALGASVKRDELAVIGLRREQAKLANTPIGSSRWGKLRKGLGRAAGGFKAVGGAALQVGGVVAGSAGLAVAGVMKLADAMDQTVKTARALGVGAEQLQELRYAAEDSGMSAKQFDTAFQRMRRRVGEGSAQAVKATTELGLNLKWLQKQTPEDQLRAIGEATQGIADQGKRLSVLQKLFDSEGAKGMAVMLNDGAKGLADMRKTARDSGSIIPEEDLLAAEQFTHELQRLKAQAFGSLAPIAADLMPKLVEKLRLGVKWLQDNRTQIAAFGEKAGQALSAVLGFIPRLVGFGQTVTDLIGGWENLGIAIGGAWLAFKIGSGPIGWALIGIGLGVKSLIDNWDELGRSFKFVWEEWIAPSLQGVRDKLQGVLDVLNKIPGVDLKLGNFVDLPATEAGGGRASAAAARAGGAPVVQQAIKVDVSADLDEASVRRAHETAARRAAEAARSGGLYDMTPAGVGA